MIPGGTPILGTPLTVDVQGEATVAEIWSSLEERTKGLARDVPESWALLSSERYGLPEEQAMRSVASEADLWGHGETM